MSASIGARSSRRWRWVGSRWWIGAALAVTALVLPGSAAPATRATAASVQADPNFAAWRAALEAQARKVSRRIPFTRAVSGTTAAGAAPAGLVCITTDDLRDDLRREHELREALLESLERRGILPSPPPPGVAPWPWACAPAPGPHLANFDTTDTAVIVDDGNIVFINGNGDKDVDARRAARAFYATHDDEYDFLVLFTNFYTSLAGANLVAYHMAVANDIEGLGYTFYNHGEHFSDDLLYTRKSVPGRLQSFVHLNNVNYYGNPDSSYLAGYTPLTVLAHEVGHRWLARVRLVVPDVGPEPVILGQQNSHWSFFFQSGASVVEGNDWEILGPNRFRTRTPFQAYGPLDLYLMGMVPPAEVPGTALWYVDSPTNPDPEVDPLTGGGFYPGSLPRPGISVSGDQKFFTVADVVNANGARLPAYPAARRDFKLAFVLLTSPETPVRPHELAELEAMRVAFQRWFHDKTLGRGNADPTLHRVPGRVVFSHRAHGDVEDPTQPTHLATHIDIEPWTLPLHVEAVRLDLFWAVDAGAFTSVPMSSSAPGEFAADIPPQPLGSTVHYYMRSTDNYPGHSYVWPEGAPAHPFDFHVAADTQGPTLQFVPRGTYSRFAEPPILRALVRDAHGIASVRVEYRVSGGDLQSRDMPAQGLSDIFETRLELPGRMGQTIEYRIVATDVSDTPHVTSSPSNGYYSLQLTREQIEDVEREDPMWTHRTLDFEGIDQWHHEIVTNHTVGGNTCWKVGPSHNPLPNTGHIAPFQQAVLEGPALTLFPGATLSFWHKYYFLLDEFNPRHQAVDGGAVEWQDVNVAADVAADRWWEVDPDARYPFQLGQASNRGFKYHPVWAGEQPDWRYETFHDDLGRMAGLKIRFRFRLATGFDPYREGRDGWYIDDITIDPGPPPNAVTLESFDAERVEAGVRLAWRVREAESGGVFRIYRGPGADAGTGAAYAIVGAVNEDAGRTEYSFDDREARSERSYAYRLVLAENGQETVLRELYLGPGAPHFALHQNRPNPFNPSTTIEYAVPRPGRTRLAVYDAQGRLVRVLVDAVLEAGSHRALWNGTDTAGRHAASGLYFDRLTSESRSQVRRMLMLQ